MADLFQRKGREFVIAGPQFDMDPSNIKFISETIAKNVEVTVYTVPAGKTLYINKIILIVDGTSIDDYWWVKLNSKLIYYNNTLSKGTNVEIDFPIPIPLLAGQTITTRWTNTAGVSTQTLAVIGWLV